jgi:hypothetical protein
MYEQLLREAQLIEWTVVTQLNSLPLTTLSPAHNYHLFFFKMSENLRKKAKTSIGEQ